MAATGYIGEVIEASTTQFTAESRELYSPPPFGSFVKIPWKIEQAPEALPQTSPASQDDKDPFMEPFLDRAGSFSADYRTAVHGEPEEVCNLQPAIYAIVHEASTSPADSSRRIRAYWKDEDQLDREHPEISEWMLVTHFKAVVIGYSAGGAVNQILPPQPPKILSHVYPCSTEEVRIITKKLDFLRTLTGIGSMPAEEVIAASIREACAARNNSFDYLVSAGRELANLLKDDYDRLQAIIRRVQL
ncbi:MAG TPA: hypothetical protein DCL60_05245 [Armatimonadetes bacterium]|jgi:hypothetical protein|nr:hypothetical protein [Armatimonadota bacterium]